MSSAGGALLGGTDGFRGPFTTSDGPGLVNAETFAGATYALIGQRLASGARGPVVVARDTRPSGEALAAAALRGAAAHDVEVWDLGVAPTPAAQKIAREHDALATIVVTASHNPAADNGWKGMPGSRKPDADEVAALSQDYWLHDGWSNGLPVAVGKIRRRPELLEDYAAQVVADISDRFGDTPLRGRHMVVDGAHGAASRLTPLILRRLGARVTEFCCDDGVINQGCGAADLRSLEAFLRQQGPALTGTPDWLGAVANDGDGDRLMLADLATAGQPVQLDGNHVMWALAQGEPGIVGTEYTNGGLRKRLTEAGIDFASCPNGDVHVSQALRARQAQGMPWRRGGEFTGHLVDLDWLESGDGVRMAAWYAAWVASRSMTFAGMHDTLPLWPEVMRAVPCADPEVRRAMAATPEFEAALHQAQRMLGEGGRVIVRPSGTEPVIRVWAEGPDHATTQKAVDELYAATTRAIGAAG